MLTYGTKFPAFQVTTHMGPGPGKQPVELTGRRLEGKWRTPPRRAALEPRLTEPRPTMITRQKGDRTLPAA